MRRWLVPAIGGGVLGVAAVSVALVMAASGAPACAAPVSGAGRATYFDGSKGGNCSFGPPSSNLYVALGPQEYQAGAACGGYIDVKGPKGSVRVKVVDQCPECEKGHLDLSEAAFARIGNVSEGIIPISYKGVQNPPLPGPITMKVKDGASQYWLALLADNHGNPLAKLEVKAPSGGWVAMKHTDYNYWLDEDGDGRGPFTVRLTDVFGHQATVAGITLSPLKLQKTTTMMYGPAAPKRSPSAKPSASSPAASSSSSAGPASGSAAEPAAVPSAPDVWAQTGLSCKHG
jgi:expansin (peptidoglycan-binding protein)